MRLLLLLFPLAIFPSCEIVDDIDDFSFHRQEDRFALIGYISPQNGVEIVSMKAVAPTSAYADYHQYDTRIFLCDEDGHDVAEAHSDDFCHFRIMPSECPIDVSKRYYIRAMSDTLSEAHSLPSDFPPPVLIDSVVLHRGATSSTCQMNVYFNNDSLSSTTLYGVRLTLYGHDIAYVWREVRCNISRHGPSSVSMRLSELNGKDSVSVQLLRYSDDVVKYEYSLAEAHSAENDFYYETVTPIFNNIIGGYGCVGTYSADTYVSTIPDW